jgi:hypothetical protein
LSGNKFLAKNRFCGKDWQLFNQNLISTFASSLLVKIDTDNQNVVTNTGSMKSELQSLAIEIFNLCIRKNISIEEEWIPPEQNQTADAYSKVFNYDDWSISDKMTVIPTSCYLYL